jgi:hypothetical protein
MTIIYIPSGKGHTFSPTKFSEIITEAAKFNPFEQNQYKRFIFCNMSAEEEQLVRCQHKEDIAKMIGVPQSQAIKHNPNLGYIYLQDIGSIKMR